MRIPAAIASGVTSLRRTQAADGHFDTFYSPTAEPFQAQAPYQTTFLPSLILAALGRVDGSAGVREPLAEWLLKQHTPAWSYNYWPLDSPERAKMAYPDDLDDTFCALAGLYLHDPMLIDATVWGKIVRLLLATESKVGGPYRTWVMPPSAPKAWLDVDVAVNANVAYFLRLGSQQLPNITRYLEQAIRKKLFTSPYYPSPYPILYYIARAYRGERQHELAAYILGQRSADGHWGTPLATALMLSALDELGDASPQETALSYILDAQQRDGSWPAEPFWLEIKYMLSGSPGLSTALILEALQKHMPAAAAPQGRKTDRRGEKLCEQIVAEVGKRSGSLGPALRAQAKPTFKRMVAGDHNREIMLLAHFFTESLQKPATIPLATLRNLGLANLYGWTAYTIYDDVLDSGGDTRLLCIANTSLRWSLEAFQSAAPDSPAYQIFVGKIFETIDNANAWEASHCRFGLFNGKVSVGPLPDYGNLSKLAERSLGHALTPLGILAALGILPDDPRGRSLVRALKHYLIARQLGDDMRDWEEDLRAGQCSYVVAELLKACGVKPGVYSFDTVVPKMRAQAWSRTLVVIGAQVLEHIELARRDLKKSRLVRPDSLVGQLLDDLQTATNHTLAEHADAKTFLKSYQK
jgi:hypothetical protein